MFIIFTGKTYVEKENEQKGKLKKGMCTYLHLTMYIYVSVYEINTLKPKRCIINVFWKFNPFDSTRNHCQTCVLGLTFIVVMNYFSDVKQYGFLHW